MAVGECLSRPCLSTEGLPKGGMWAAKPRETQNLEEKQGISLSLIHTSGGVEGGADPRVLSDVEKQHLFVRQQKKAKEKNACMIESLFVACVMPVVRERAWLIWPPYGGGRCHQLCCSWGDRIVSVLATSGSSSLDFGAPCSKQTLMPWTSAINVGKVVCPQACRCRQCALCSCGNLRMKTTKTPLANQPLVSEPGKTRG